MKELIDNLKKMIGALDRRGRLLLGVGVVVILVTVIGLGYWAFRSNYQVLFAELDSRDAAAIVEELKRAKVPYRLSDGGTKILVKEDAVHETRLGLMSKGVSLSGGVGFEIFDNKDVGMTDYTQKINYQRALQGELARTIMATEQVKVARVHLVVPESSIFKRDKARAKASISLVLKPGGNLNSEQIVSIQRLVSAAVPGLEPAMVTIVDQRGTTLSARTDADGELAGATGKLHVKKQVEDYFTHKIAEVLDRTFGPGQAIVSVDVSLNLDETQRTLEEIIPLNGGGDEPGALVRKRQAVNRQGQRGSAKIADGDVNYSGVTSPYTNATTEVEYAFGKRIEHMVSTPGGVRRLSVGVLVPPQLANEQLDRIRDIVRMVVGFDATRGDAIVVHSIDQLIHAQASPVAAAIPANAMGAMTDAPAVGDFRSLWERVMAAVARLPMSRELMMMASAIGLSVLLAVMMVTRRTLAGRRRRLETPRLSERERQQLLLKVRGWLNTDALAKEVGHP